MMYDVIIFDFDGTLAYSKDDVWESIKYAANIMGKQIPEQIVSDSTNLMLSTSELLKKIDVNSTLKECEDFDKHISFHYRKLNTFENTLLYPYIDDLLNKLKSNSIPCYIVTLKPLEALERILTKKCWGDFFNGWFSPDSFGTINKSKQELLSILIQRDTNKKYVYIGDSFSDIIAAKANNIETIGVLYGDGLASAIEAENPTYKCLSSRDIDYILFNKTNGK